MSLCLLILDIAFISVAVWLFVQTHVFILPEFVITNKSDGLCESKCLILNERIRVFSNVTIPFHVPTNSVYVSVVCIFTNIGTVNALMASYSDRLFHFIVF